ncbi:MAG: putative dioxygenase [Burkholderiales bacterium]|jgi:carotenoid cleavage dioxygenase-like enzyme|nr:putative dioxygenase [Burkholderiales bacterium]
MNHQHAVIFDDVSETPKTKLNVEGELPAWLSGDLIRNGPGLFNFSGVKLNHWFDGMAVIHKFSFGENQVYYQSKFLQSRAYISAIREHKIVSSEFATSPKQSFIRHIYDILKGVLTDNNNVNIVKFGKYYLTMTETDNHVLVDPETLSIVRPHTYDDKIKFIINLAHPIIEEGGNLFYNLGIKFGSTSRYILYRTNVSTNNREVIAKIPTKRPSYMHTFAKTENFFILYENPLKVNPLKMLFSDKPFIKNYIWGDDPVNFIIVDKAGKIIRQFTHEQFFCFHMVNAYEYASKIYLDLIVYPNADIIKAFYLEPRVNLEDKNLVPLLRRFVLNLSDGSCSSYKPDVPGIEFPYINGAYAQKLYNFIYAVSSRNNDFSLNTLIKINLSDLNANRLWQQDDCFPGEPVFVAKPDATMEDEGVIISVIADLKNKLSFLLILDAESFNEITRINLPHLLPIGLHGSFYSDVIPANTRVWKAGI